AQERLKTQFNPDSLSIRARTLFYGFNARPFLRTIENITGIEGLIPDPYFLGGGFHETTQGGHLSIHADFNHHKPMDLERRVNVLIYLNDDWDESYGGCLELWDRGMKSRVQSYVPTCNRCVIFSTTTDSYHGNPEPVNHPRLVSRKSIALYYYTSTWTEEKRGQTTQFRVRKGTDDRIDWTVKRNELIADLIPPVLARSVRRIRASRRRRD
ncbi:MAG: 2OG-Fe(II) oxygenase, partial [Caulobacteraceae bacterium]